VIPLPSVAQGTVTVSLHLEAKAPKLLMLELAERAAAATTVRETEGVSKTYVVEEDQVLLYEPLRSARLLLYRSIDR